MDLGFDKDLAALAALSATASPIVVVAAGVRRRLDKDHDGQIDPGVGQGASWIPVELQGLAVLLVAVVVGAVAVFGVGLPLFPALSATATGFLGGMVTTNAVRR